MGKILLVDDEREFLEALKASMESAGFEVILADSAREALHLIKSKQYVIDCVLTDYRMPEMRGDELAYAIKHTTEIPVVIMTGDTSVAVDVLFKAGISGVINKPFSSSNFIEFLKNNDLHIEVNKQRKFLRQKSSHHLQKIEVFNGRDTVLGEIVNISNGGLGVMLEATLEPMSTVQFTLKIDGQEVKGFMHCRWRSKAEERMNAGFEFDSLTKKSLAANSLYSKWVTIAELADAV